MSHEQAPAIFSFDQFDKFVWPQSNVFLQAKKIYANGEWRTFAPGTLKARPDCPDDTVRAVSLLSAHAIYAANAIASRAPYPTNIPIIFNRSIISNPNFGASTAAWFTLNGHELNYLDYVGLTRSQLNKTQLNRIVCSLNINSLFADWSKTQYHPDIRLAFFRIRKAAETRLVEEAAHALLYTSCFASLPGKIALQQALAEYPYPNDDHYNMVDTHYPEVKHATHSIEQAAARWTERYVQLYYPNSH